jgi:hypothetical protein
MVGHGMPIVYLGALNVPGLSLTKELIELISYLEVYPDVTLASTAFEAIYSMIIHHTNGLHIGIDNCGANKTHAALFQILR